MLAHALKEGTPSPVPAGRHVIGVFLGEGIGPEVVPAAISLLTPLSQWSGRQFDIRYGGPIGYEALEKFGTSLPPEAIAFAADVFRDAGALFCGPGGERFVYSLRTQFDLYCKFSPLKPVPALEHIGPVAAARLAGVDIVAVRENVGGLYQGEWSELPTPDGGRVATHQFQYRSGDVERILDVAINLARRRRQRVCVVVKPGGIPSISRLWTDIARDKTAQGDIALSVLEIDNAVYQLIAAPDQFDVIVSPNMFGDVLADCGALLLGSRGLSYSGNFGPDRRAAYQTGHGAARDIAGLGIANPLGQMYALAMMLDESFMWPEGGLLVRQAIEDALASGVRTRDLGGSADAGATTLDMTRAVVHALEQRIGRMPRP